MNKIRTIFIASLCAVTWGARAEDVRVCVEVEFGVLEDPKPKDPPTVPPDAPAEEPPVAKPPAPAKGVQPLPPRAYLRRMLNHFVQHEPGFVAVRDRCQQTLSVELYATSVGGWTVFGRYSGFESEEKVDRVELTEFPKLARRLVRSLLYNQRIEATITRTSVLEADSATSEKTVRGNHMFQMGIGSTVRFPVGGLMTAVPGAPDAAPENRFRLVNPVDLQLGYRGDFREWAIDAYTRIGIGVSYTDSRSNTKGGHIDHVADFQLGMNFLWYLNPDDVSSFYMGAGARFELTAFDVVEPEDSYDKKDLIGAGLTVIGVFGFEFLRTTNVRLYGQLELALPVHVVRTENRDGGIDTWLPGASLALGALF